jgi:hypothetical protein
LVDFALSLVFPHQREGKAPFQTVHADFPHTAYRWSLESQHYAASFQEGCPG